MNQFFQFEADFIKSMRCIPMQVRLNLDTCGVKLKLDHWHQLSSQERQELLSMPCTTSEESNSYRQFLQNLVIEKTNAPAKELPIDEHPPWLNSGNIPPETADKARIEFGVTITVDQWEQLSPLQRFALIKLSRPSHENKNFYPALKEFGLIEETVQAEQKQS